MNHDSLKLTVGVGAAALGRAIGVHA